MCGHPGVSNFDHSGNCLWITANETVADDVIGVLPEDFFLAEDTSHS